jgi:hypothetical protein
VYDLIENGIQKIRAGSLKDLLATYFGQDSIVFLNSPSDLEHLRSTHANAIAHDKIIAIKNIHRCRTSTQEWENIKNGRGVRLSIDLYEYGLLSFRPDFKQKQHFIIKYPA